jgi:hypothetical protein
LARLAVAVALVACAFPLGAEGAGWSPRACARHAGWDARNAHTLLRQWDDANVYPADVAYLLFRDGVKLYVAHGCNDRALGRALRAELSQRERTRLVSLLPSDLARTIRRALAVGL